MSSLIVPALNLGILIAVLTYFLRKPILKSVADRHDSIKKTVTEVSTLLSGAKSQVAEISGKLNGAANEGAAIIAQSKKDAATTGERIASEAKKVSVMVISDAKAMSTNIFSDVKRQMGIEFAEKVIGRTEKLLRERLTTSDRARIRSEFTGKVKGFEGGN
jgi:F0F1-type ATP synthase membrane subunit b/b'